MLALLGGSPITNRSWPSWPIASREELDLLLKVLDSRVWTITSYIQDIKSLHNILFSENFAQFLGVSHCVTVTNGSAALVCALQVLGVGHGDEVLIPALTWPACATAVIRCGAIPVLVDVNPKTLCMDLNLASEMVTPRTKALLVVHLYAAMINPVAIKEFSEKFNLAILEDCSHIPGARWENQYAGTFGDCGTFSFQQSKILTAGEGGAIVTNDDQIAECLEQLRADGRIYIKQRPTKQSFFALEQVGEVIGTNYCLSEFQAAILEAQLKRLSEQNAIRRLAAESLDRALNKVPGITPQLIDERITPSYYYYVVRLDRTAFAQRTVQTLAKALEAELGFPVSEIYPSLKRSTIYRPGKAKFPRWSADYTLSIDPSHYNAPEADAAYEECLALHHRILLESPQVMEEIAAAFDKVRYFADELPEED